MPQVVLMLVYTLMNVYTWQRTFIKQRWCPPTRVECILGTRVSTASLCVFRCMLHLAILIACFADHIIQVRLCGPTGNRRRAPEGTPATSATRQSSPPTTSAPGLGSRLPYLHQDYRRPLSCRVLAWSAMLSGADRWRHKDAEHAHPAAAANAQRQP